MLDRYVMRFNPLLPSVTQVSSLKMKLICFITFLACVTAMPKHLVLPRLPLSVILNGNYQPIPEDKIVGGSVVEPNSLPFLVSIQRRNGAGAPWTHLCGGSIIDDKTIISAGHCVIGSIASNLLIVAGEHSLSTNSGLEQAYLVGRYLVNKNYNIYTYENDIALIYPMEDKLDLSVPSAKAINLPGPYYQYDPPAGTILTVAGWGTKGSGGTLQDLLNSVDLPVVSDDDCRKAYGGNSTNPVVYDSMICAGSSYGGLDSCQGDSGGPLFSGSGSNAVQHGIVSWGQGCALAQYPGVYTQVSHFLEWIEANRGRKHGNLIPCQV